MNATNSNDNVYEFFLMFTWLVSFSKILINGSFQDRLK